MALTPSQLRNRIKDFLAVRGLALDFTVSANADGQSFGVKFDSKDLNDQERVVLQNFSTLFNEWADKDNPVFNFTAYGDAPRKVRLERAGKTDS